ncbi:hypothetical protein GIB67_015144 [Kingdonia uniflora]|uniref:glutathione transferase n=1 Tax=Kingdonia uniflora TaxID=39325 RepID=A0A7J7LJF1_9MAGN|nr:hypothetical protein GIB67_015144 [Kingdonia uniflora]
MAPKLYGMVFSTATMRAAAALNEKEVEFEFVPVDLNKGEHKKHPYLAMNPFGQVPALEVGDLKLFESRAITQYVAHEYANKGTQLLGLTSEKMAVVGVWLEVEAHQFDPVSSKLAFESVFKPMLGLGATDTAVVKETEAKLGQVLDVYEARLG